MKSILLMTVFSRQRAYSSSQMSKQRFRRFDAWLLLVSSLTLVLTILYFMTFSPTVAGTQTGIAGLTERVLVVELLGWFVALAAFALNRLFVSETAANI